MLISATMMVDKSCAAFQVASHFRFKSLAFDLHHVDCLEGTGISTLVSP